MHNIVMSFTLKFHDIVVHHLKIFLLVLVCCSFQFFLLFYTFLYICFFLFSLLTFFDFSLYSILSIISYVSYGFLFLLSTFSTKSLVVPKLLFLILFHCTSTFLLSHSISLLFASRLSCTFSL